MKLSNIQYRQFLVSDIFYIRNGKGITKQEIEDNEGELNAVQSGEENNGVMGKISKDYCKKKNYTFTDKPCLTVARSGTAGFVSIQAKGCVVGDSAKILELKETQHNTINVLLFMQTLLSANRFKYTYGYKVTTRKYNNMILELPVNQDGQPDWDFMENYIKSLRYKPISTRNKERVISLEGVRTKKFIFGEIIDEIYKGKAINKDDLTKAENREKSIRYITRTAEDNGCELRANVDEINSVMIEKGNAISIGDTTATCFYQDKEFIVGDHMVIVRAEWMNKYRGMFIVTLLNSEQYKYSYGRAFVMDKIKNTVLHLPVNEFNEPDWQFMEDYIKSLPYGDRI